MLSPRCCKEGDYTVCFEVQYKCGKEGKKEGRKEGMKGWMDGRRGGC